MRLKDKVALITGAASGMGRSTALLFAREGARVMVADMLEAEGRQVVAEIEAAGGQAMFQPLDVPEEDHWEAAMAAVLARWVRLDILVQYAGISGKATSAAIDEVLMIDPPPLFSMSGMAYFMPRKTPLRLTAMVRSKSSSLQSAVLARPP